MRKFGFGVAFCVLAAPALAQNFTTAAEVKPILSATKSNWIAVREFDGRDLLYFTQIEAWRCGLSQIRFSINGGKMQVWDIEPCYENEPQPNAMKLTDRPPFGDRPSGSIETVKIQLIFDDGSKDSAQFDRNAVLVQ